MCVFCDLKFLVSLNPTLLLFSKAFKLDIWMWMKLNRWKREEGPLGKGGARSRPPEGCRGSLWTSEQILCKPVCEYIKRWETGSGEVNQCHKALYTMLRNLLFFCKEGGQGRGQWEWGGDSLWVGYYYPQRKSFWMLWPNQHFKRLLLDVSLCYLLVCDLGHWCLDLNRSAWL